MLKLQGRVVSAKQKKSATVLISSRKLHPLYKKSFKRSKRYLAHDELGVVVGDVVEMVDTKPISKNKHFRITKVLGRDIEAVVSEELKEKAEEAIAEVMPEEKEKK